MYIYILDVAMFQKEQLHFSQCLSAVLSTLSCQLVAALSGQYNPERHFNSDNNDASTKWLEQIACIGLLVKFEVLLLPDRVSIRFSYNIIIRPMILPPKNRCQ